MVTHNGARLASTRPGSWASMSDAERQRLIYGLTAPAIAAAVEALAPAPGSRGLDAGCGAGNHTPLLARAAAPEGRVTGLDRSLATLREAEVDARTAPASDQVLRVNGSFLALPFPDGSFDWVWCADALWPQGVVDDPVDAVRQLARVVRPGGAVALLFWSGQTLLSGYPELEARLGVAFAEHTACFASVPPPQHHLRALVWLRQAGLHQTRAKSFVAEATAPLSPALRAALNGCFEMLWGEVSGCLGAADRDTFRRLCSADSPESVLDQPGYHAFVIYTLFVGTRPLAAANA
jgi:ubiquinone/menaquinone biosynthesis C-methylase UbiE